MLRVGQQYALKGIARDALGAANVTFGGENPIQLLYRPNIDAAAQRFYAVNGQGEVTPSNVVLQARDQIACILREHHNYTEV